LLLGCAGSGPSPARPESSDQPVSPDEPRAELGLRLDLEPAGDCEERFDLALYENRAVELVAWDTRHERCEGRTARIRYLSRHIDAEGVLVAVRALVLRVERLPPAGKSSHVPAVSPAATAPSASAPAATPAVPPKQ
jgi:hypothetical protein